MAQRRRDDDRAVRRLGPQAVRVQLDDDLLVTGREVHRGQRGFAELVQRHGIDSSRVRRVDDGG